MRTSIIAALLCVSVARSMSAGAPHLVRDLRFLPDSGESSEPSFVGTAGSVAILSAPFADRQAIWRTDGTAAGTFPLIDGAQLAAEDTDPVLVTPEAVYLGVLQNGWRIWTTDGTVAGTKPVTPATQVPQQPIGVIGQKLSISSTCRSSGYSMARRPRG